MHLRQPLKLHAAAILQMQNLHLDLLSISYQTKDVNWQLLPPPHSLMKQNKPV
jgi:hypothetical protein